MEIDISKYIRKIERDTSLPINDNIVRDIQGKLDFNLPGDYIEVVYGYNGGEGEVGKVSYLKLFPFDELIEINNDYADLMEAIPDFFLFGKDAADTGYAFHKINHSYHEFGLMSNFQTDQIMFCGNNFLEFIEYLYAKE